MGKSASRTRLPLGKVVITATARAVLSTMDVCIALERHQSGDWGEVSKADGKVNDNAVGSGERVLSAYTAVSGNKFWIITEADRSYTTILLPDDY